MTLIGEDAGFIVAHPLRRNQYAREVIGALYRKFDKNSEEEQFFDDVRKDVRFIVAYSPKIAREVREGRRKRLAKADAWIRRATVQTTLPRRERPQGNAARNVRQDPRLPA